MYQARPLLPTQDQIQMRLPFLFIFNFYCLVYDAQFFSVIIYKVKKFDA